MDKDSWSWSDKTNGLWSMDALWSVTVHKLQLYHVHVFDSALPEICGTLSCFRNNDDASTFFYAFLLCSIRHPSEQPTESSWTGSGSLGSGVTRALLRLRAPPALSGMRSGGSESSAGNDSSREKPTGIRLPRAVWNDGAAAVRDGIAASLPWYLFFAEGARCVQNCDFVRNKPDHLSAFWTRETLWQQRRTRKTS